MIKHTSHKFSNTISKLFNLIARVGHFRDIWNRGVITPIFKSGNKFDPTTTIEATERSDAAASSLQHFTLQQH